MRFEKAGEKDKKEILALYKGVLGEKCCPWNEEYPGEKEIDFDLSREALFVLRDDRDEIVGTISYDCDAEVEGLPFWSKEIGPTVELSRLGVRKDCQNMGIAGLLLNKVMDRARDDGYNGVHFLVAKMNVKTIKAYDKVGFDKVGETFIFGNDYLGYERVFT